MDIKLNEVLRKATKFISGKTDFYKDPGAIFLFMKYVFLYKKVRVFKG